MAKEYGISYMGNDAQVWALIYTGPKENTTKCGAQKVMLMNVGYVSVLFSQAKRAEPSQMKPDLYSPLNGRPFGDV